MFRNYLTLSVANECDYNVTMVSYQVSVQVSNVHGEANQSISKRDGDVGVKVVTTAFKYGMPISNEEQQYLELPLGSP